jgi:acetyl/propionyl-CoA carboxylase alpha subunit
MERRRFIKSLVKSLLLRFCNDGMYLEKLIEEPRHIEIQVVEIHTEKHVTF